MQNRAVEAFDSKLSALLAEVDALLEDRFGKDLTLHPARPPRGATANPQYDGLFTIEAKFSAGIGSHFGPGYSLDLRAATTQPVSEAQQAAWEALMVEHLRKRLPEVFPDRELKVDRDALSWKLHGDLSITREGGKSA